MSEPRSAVAPAELRTRDHVARLILETGPMTAAALAQRLELSTAGVRRHLDALVEDGVLVEVDPRPSGRRGRGRPARAYALTETGRNAFPHGYDELATTALRYLRDSGGSAAVAAFADHRARELESTLLATGEVSITDRSPRALARALSSAGYAATTESATAGTQLCQHHCPVAHVAAEFPELCEAETRAFERILGTYAQRLATIAHGDGVCTTHVPQSTTKNSASGVAL